MKVAGNITSKQTIEGSFTKEDLLAVVKRTLAIPAEADASFYVQAPGNLNMGGQAYVTPTVYVDGNTPLCFRITWSVPVGKDEQG